MAKKAKGETQLGGKSKRPASPDEAQLDSVENPQKDTDYVTRFTCPEFTSIHIRGQG